MTGAFNDAPDTGWFPSAAVTAAEMAVLGSAIQSREAAELMAERLRSDDFFKSAHQLVYEAIGTLINETRPVDPGSVLDELTRRGSAEQAGAGPGLMKLIEHSVPVVSVDYHAGIVRDDGLRRRLYFAAKTIQQSAESHAFNADTDVEAARKVLDDACTNAASDEPPSVNEVLAEVVDGLDVPLDESRIVPPPYKDMEFYLSGFRGGQLITLAARPGCGKSTIALDWLRNTSIRLGLPSLMVTLEMTRQEVMQRMIAAEGSVDLKRLQDRAIGEHDWPRIAKAHDRILDSPMVIDDHPEYSLARLRSRLRSMGRRNPARLVVVDYLQLMKMPKADSREQSVAAMSRGLKLLAREFEVPVLLLAQLNRGPEQRTDKRPVMSDIRESGAIEQDSDIVLLIHREAGGDQEHPKTGETDLIIDKHRNGPRGTVTIGFMGHYARGCNLSKPHDPGATWSAA
jgi:replicative DNA helicase